MPEYKFDFSKITLGEYRSITDVTKSDSESDAIIARVAGLEPADLEAMAFDEWRQFMRAFWNAARSAGDEEKN